MIESKTRRFVSILAILLGFSCLPFQEVNGQFSERWEHDVSQQFQNPSRLELTAHGERVVCFSSQNAYVVLNADTGRVTSQSSPGIALSTIAPQRKSLLTWDQNGTCREVSVLDDSIVKQAAYHTDLLDLRGAPVIGSGDRVFRIDGQRKTIFAFDPFGNAPVTVFEASKPNQLRMLLASANTLYVILGGKLAAIPMGEGGVPKTISSSSVRSAFGLQTIGDDRFALAGRDMLILVNTAQDEVEAKEVKDTPEVGFPSDDLNTIVGYSNHGEHQPPSIEYWEMKSQRNRCMPWGTEEIRAAAWDEVHHRLVVVNNAGKIACFVIER